MQNEFVTRINKEAIDLWMQYTDGKLGQRIAEHVLMPKQYPSDLNLNAPVLFVGLNPSFTDERRDHLLQLATREPGLFAETITVNNAQSTLNEAFEWSRTDTDIDRRSRIIAELETEGLKTARGFTPFRKLANEIFPDCPVDKSWMHLDLFFWHGTKQNEALDILFDKKKSELNEFGQQQLKITWTLLQAAKPKVILVANAKGAEIFKEFFQISRLGTERNVHDRDYRCDFLLYEQNTPVLFSSQLHGGHLDRWSFERLKWHMRRAIESR